MRHRGREKEHSRRDRKAKTHLESNFGFNEVNKCLHSAFNGIELCCEACFRYAYELIVSNTNRRTRPDRDGWGSGWRREYIIECGHDVCVCNDERRFDGRGTWENWRGLCIK